MYKIDKNIPLNSAHGRKYPFDNMEVDDSFLVEFSNQTPKQKTLVQNRICSAISYYNKKTKTKFTTRRIKEGIRVWRIK